MPRQGQVGAGGDGSVVTVGQTMMTRRFARFCGCLREGRVAAGRRGRLSIRWRRMSPWPCGVHPRLQCQRWERSTNEPCPSPCGPAGRPSSLAGAAVAPERWSEACLHATVTGMPGQLVVVGLGCCRARRSMSARGRAVHRSPALAARGGSRLAGPVRLGRFRVGGGPSGKARTFRARGVTASHASGVEAVAAGPHRRPSPAIMMATRTARRPSRPSSIQGVANLNGWARAPRLGRPLLGRPTRTAAPRHTADGGRPMDPSPRSRARRSRGGPVRSRRIPSRCQWRLRIPDRRILPGPIRP
jgi:hypothetical protein